MIKSYNVYDMISSIFINSKFSNHKKQIKSSILSSVILSSLSWFKSAGKPNQFGGKGAMVSVCFGEDFPNKTNPLKSPTHDDFHMFEIRIP